jgi:sulfoxide reductase heme-binding subunit YedZ
MIGLLVYFYVMLHLLAYSWFDMGFEVADIGKDIVKRPFILVGFTAFLLLTPMALTSFNRAIRVLGAIRWKQLHKAVYGVAVLAVLHFFWMRAGKNNLAEVFVYGAVLGALLVWRLKQFLKKNGR